MGTAYLMPDGKVADNPTEALNAWYERTKALEEDNARLKKDLEATRQEEREVKAAFKRRMEERRKLRDEAFQIEMDLREENEKLKRTVKEAQDVADNAYDRKQELVAERASLRFDYNRLKEALDDIADWGCNCDDGSCAGCVADAALSDVAKPKTEENDDTRTHT